MSELFKKRLLFAQLTLIEKALCCVIIEIRTCFTDENH